MIAAHPVLGLDMPNDRLDRSTTARRRISRRINAVPRRTRPLIQTRYF
jgi:hypothetical protein